MGQTEHGLVQEWRCFSPSKMAAARRDAGWRRVYGDSMRIGALSTDQAARDAVERALGEVGS